MKEWYKFWKICCTATRFCYKLLPAVIVVNIYEEGKKFIDITIIIIEYLSNRITKKYVLGGDNFLPSLRCWLDEGNYVLRLLAMQGQDEGVHQMISRTSLTSDSMLSVGSRMKETFISRYGFTIMVSHLSQHLTTHKRIWDYTGEA